MEAEKNNVGNTETSRVVHASVTNLLYPVDIDLIHFLFSRYGDVEKIVTFSKSPTMYQALIQFQNADQAREALAKLHGRNIYDGCNTLQIQPSRLQELVVKSNTTKSWDYTIQRGGPSANLPGGASGAAAAGGLAPPGGAAVGGGGVVVVDGQQQLGPGGLGAVNNGRGAAGAGTAGPAGVAGGAAGWAPPPHVHAAAAGGYGQQQQQHATPPMPGAAGGGAAAGGAAASAGGAAGVPPRLLHPHVGPPPHPLQQQHGGVGMQPPPPNHHGVGLAPGGPAVQQQHPVHAMQPPHPLAAGGAAAGSRMGGGAAAGGMGPLGAGHHHGSNLLHLLDKVPRELRETMEYTNNNQTPVIIVYNLPANVTVQMLFNVFSLYGSVLRIKILREKSDTALIQYSDPLYASIAQHYIQGANVMGQTLQVAFSKNMEVKLPPPQPAKADGAAPVEEEKRTVAFSIRDQRYGGDDVEKYVKGSCKPTKTIFVANLDEAATEDEIQKLFSEYGSVSKFTFKAPKSESAKTQMAMMEMGSEAEALAALMYLHNHELHGRSMKVAFSKTVL